ncbi:MAG: enoyl-CoA hydratase/isomerase family protein [Flavobacteriaceae bacterium]|nr:enoyl-CoA hydratase/isomerase family protein [Flavobacteriaceae bacterium]
MSYDNIKTEITGYTSLITINRPSKLNALNKQTIEELGFALADANKSSEIRCVVITGSGTKAFVAGADIKEFSDFRSKQGVNLAKVGQEILFDYIENMSKPVIAAVNGFALGGGLELAMACHIRVASHNAKMGLPETSLGLIPGYGGTQRLPQLIGKGKAMELIVTAGMLDAEEAYNYKLVNHIVEQDDLLGFCMKMAKKISFNSPNAISAAIKSVNAGFDSEGYKQEINNFGECFDSEDFKEGTTAFLEKRKPNF